MKFQELKLGVEYGVIPSWEYSSKDKKNPETALRRQVAKATLVSLDKYEYIVYRSGQSDNQNFKPAPKGSRSVGYLVQSHEWADAGTTDSVFWLARPQDIIAPYVDLEARWVIKEAEEKAQIAKELAERQEQERVEREATAREQRIVDSCIKALNSIIGTQLTEHISAQVGRSFSHGVYQPNAEFRLNGRTMQVLIEKILEARDEVA
jgi:hypothetical protein